MQRAQENQPTRDNLPRPDNHPTPGSYEARSSSACSYASVADVFGQGSRKGINEGQPHEEASDVHEGHGDEGRHEGREEGREEELQPAGSHECLAGRD